MRNITLFDANEHKFILLNESEPGRGTIQPTPDHARQQGVVLDPGGFGVMRSVLAECRSRLMVAVVPLIDGIFRRNRIVSVSAPGLTTQ